MYFWERRNEIRDSEEKVRDAGFSWKRSGNAGSGSPLPDPGLSQGSSRKTKRSARTSLLWTLCLGSFCVTRASRLVCDWWFDLKIIFVCLQVSLALKAKCLFQIRIVITEGGIKERKRIFKRLNINTQGKHRVVTTWGEVYCLSVSNSQSSKAKSIETLQFKATGTSVCLACKALVTWFCFEF